MPDPTPRRCDGCGRGLAVYTVPPGQAPRGVTYVCLDCADRSKPSVSVAPPPTALTPEIRRWDWTGAKLPPSAEEQAAAVRAMMAIPFDEIGYLRAKLAETTEIALRLEAERWREVSGAFMLRYDPHRSPGVPRWTAAIPSVARGDGDSPDAALHALADSAAAGVAQLERERDAARARRDEVCDDLADRVGQLTDLTAQLERARQALTDARTTLSEHAEDCEQHTAHLARPGRVGPCPQCALLGRLGGAP